MIETFRGYCCDCMSHLESEDLHLLETCDNCGSSVIDIEEENAQEEINND